MASLPTEETGTGSAKSRKPRALSQEPEWTPRMAGLGGGPGRTRTCDNTVMSGTS